MGATGPRALLTAGLLVAAGCLARTNPRVIDHTPDVGPSADERCAALQAAPERYDALGAGTVADPFVLCTPAQLLHLMAKESSSAWSLCFTLGADLDLRGYDAASTPRVRPIGTLATPFTGVFRGNGHVVTDLSLDVADDWVGLFGVVSGSAAAVRDTILASANVRGGRWVGALAGGVLRGALVSGCRVSGTVAGYEGVGGVAGAVGGIWGLDGKIGGIGIVSGSSTSAAVDGYSQVGGVVGLLSSGYVINCAAAGDVSHTLSRGGGLVGWAMGGIIDSYASGNVTGGAITGGLVGELAGFATGSFAAGNVAGSAAAATGRLVGQGERAEGCASVAATSCRVFPGPGSCHGPVTGESEVAQRADLVAAASPPVATWDLTHVWAAGSGLPELRTQRFDGAVLGDCRRQRLAAPFAAGWGTHEVPFFVCTPEQLVAIGSDPALLGRWKVFELAADLDLGGAARAGFPLGTAESPFTGFFQGAGHVVAGYSLDGVGGDDHGLFGVFRGLVTRTGVTGAKVTGGGNGQGALIGTLADPGFVLDCFATGAVAASGSGVGGLVGRLQHGVILDAYFAGSVAGDSSVGGVLGFQRADTTWSAFASADVSATGAAGPVTFTDSGDAGSGAYDATRSCTGCSNSDGIAHSPTSYFFDPQSSPLDTWDFATVWRSNAPTGFPSLR